MAEPSDSDRPEIGLMDSSLYDSLCNTKVEWYENEFQEMKRGTGNVSKENILLCLQVQMDELTETCDRYKELYNWGVSRLGYSHRQS